MGICTCCGYSGPMTEYCPSCGFPNKADTGRKDLIEHGWRDKDGKDRRHYIPSSVIEPAYESIRKYGIDKWKEYENISSGMCGGSVSVRYRDGDEIVGSSLDHMGSAVADAYHELFALFAG